MEHIDNCPAQVGDAMADEAERDVSKDSLEGELSILREILGRTVREARSSSDAEFSRLGTLAVRLSDSITRAMLAQRKMDLAGDKLAAVQAEIDSVIEAMGLGPEKSGQAERSGDR